MEALRAKLYQLTDELDTDPKYQKLRDKLYKLGTVTVDDLRIQY